AELVRLANEAGGRDNVTVVLAEIVDVDAAEDATRHRDEEAPDVAADPAVWRGEGTSDDEPKALRRWFSWRVVLFLTLLVVIVLGGLGALGAYMRGGYFVGSDGESVVIYKGRPAAVLWFNPTVEKRTGLVIGDLDEAGRSDVESEHELDSLTQAERLVDSIAP
ncbi:MAG: hypothetical protein IH940_09525, partial [Acidobacteria bacterium]|nr:hypothetical protein [Acidobacteriota bacterium]